MSSEPAPAEQSPFDVSETEIDEALAACDGDAPRRPSAPFWWGRPTSSVRCPCSRSTRPPAFVGVAMAWED